MNILITGAAGFVGKNLTAALEAIRDGKDRTHPGLSIGELYLYDIDSPISLLEEACRKLDIARPIWLDKHSREWDEFGQTRFLPDDFLESVDFQRLEIEYIDPDAKKKKSRDYRNAFD